MEKALFVCIANVTRVFKRIASHRPGSNLLRVARKIMRKTEKTVQKMQPRTGPSAGQECRGKLGQVRYLNHIQRTCNSEKKNRGSNAGQREDAGRACGGCNDDLTSQNNGWIKCGFILPIDVLPLEICYRCVRYAPLTIR